MSSRNEDILKSILEGKEYGAIPQSRIEALLIDLKGLIERGGASEAEIKAAVSDYLSKHPEFAYDDTEIRNEIKMSSDSISNFLADGVLIPYGTKDFKNFYFNTQLKIIKQPNTTVEPHLAFIPVKPDITYRVTFVKNNTFKRVAFAHSNNCFEGLPLYEYHGYDTSTDKSFEIKNTNGYEYMVIYYGTTNSTQPLGEYMVEELIDRLAVAKAEKLFRSISPKEIYARRRETLFGNYRVQSCCTDGTKYYFAGGKAVEPKDGSIIIIESNSLTNFANATSHIIQHGGHANDMCYANGYLYVCTANSGDDKTPDGDALLNGILKINVNDWTSQAIDLSSVAKSINAIDYKDGVFYLASPIRIYKTKDFSSVEEIVHYDFGNDIASKVGVPKSRLGSNGIFVYDGMIICCFPCSRYNYGTNCAVLAGFDIKTGMNVFITSYSTSFGSELECGMVANGNIILVHDGACFVIREFNPYFPFEEPRILQSGESLADMTAVGTYYSLGGDITRALLDVPSGVTTGFTLETKYEGWVNRRQILTPNSNTGTVYTRMYGVNSDSCGAWQTV